jgi:hypothetical protein
VVRINCTNICVCLVLPGIESDDDETRSTNEQTSNPEQDDLDNVSAAGQQIPYIASQALPAVCQTPESENFDNVSAAGLQITYIASQGLPVMCPTPDIASQALPAVCQTNERENLSNVSAAGQKLKRTKLVVSSMDESGFDEMNNEPKLKHRKLEYVSAVSHKVKRKMPAISSSDESEFDENEPNVKHKKRRWTETETALLFQSFGKVITNQKMPSGSRLLEVAKVMNHSRTLAQIRTQVNNYIKQKRKM